MAPIEGLGRIDQIGSPGRLSERELVDLDVRQRGAQLIERLGSGCLLEPIQREILELFHQREPFLERAEAVDVDEEVSRRSQDLANRTGAWLTPSLNVATLATT